MEALLILFLLVALIFIPWGTILSFLNRSSIGDFQRRIKDLEQEMLFFQSRIKLLEEHIQKKHVQENLELAKQPALQTQIEKTKKEVKFQDTLLAVHKTADTPEPLAAAPESKKDQNQGGQKREKYNPFNTVSLAKQTVSDPSISAPIVHDPVDETLSTAITEEILDATLVSENSLPLNIEPHIFEEAVPEYIQPLTTETVSIENPLPEIPLVEETIAAKEVQDEEQEKLAIREKRTGIGLFEEQLGARWSIWVGGVAMALGGLFLVRYSIEQGYIGPLVRVILGLLLGISLVIAGEVIRRRDITANIPVSTKAHIPSVLTASGTTVLFGAIYAAHAFYHFIGTGTALISLGAIAISTLFASAIHGPALAGLGFVGAIGAPLLVNSTGSSKIPLAIYLLVVASSAFTLSHWRKWQWLAHYTLIAALVWGLLLQGIDPLAAQFHSSAQTALAALALFLFAPRGWSERRIALFACFAIGALALLNIPPFHALTQSLTEASFSDAPNLNYVILFLALNTFIVFFAASLRPRATPLLGVAIFMAFVILWIWPSTDGAMHAIFTYKNMAFNIPGPLTNKPVYIIWLVVLVGSLVAVPILCLLGKKYKSYIAMSMAQVIIYSMAPTFGAAALLGIGGSRIRLTYFNPWVPSIIGFLGTCLFAACVLLFYRAGATRHRNGRIIIEIFCIAAVSFAAFFLTRTFAEGWMTVSFSLVAFGLACIAVRFPTRTLPTAIGLSSLIVLGRLLANPLVMSSGVGDTPFFNWLLLGYAAPAVGYAYAWHIMDRRGIQNWGSRMSLCMAIVLAALFATFELRHYLYEGDLFAPTTSLIEQGLMVTLAMSFALALSTFDGLNTNRIFRIGSALFSTFGFGQTLFSLLLIYNPYLTGEVIKGIPILNTLFLSYLIPAAMTLMTIIFNRKHRSPYLSHMLSWQLLLLLLAYCLLNIHLILHGGENMEDNARSLFEMGLIAVIIALFTIGVQFWRQRSPETYPPLSILLHSVVFADLAYTLGMKGLSSLSNHTQFGALYQPFDRLSSTNLWWENLSTSPLLSIALLLPSLCAIAFVFLWNPQNNAHGRKDQTQVLAKHIMGWSGILLLYVFIILIGRRIQFGSDHFALSEGHYFVTISIAATGAFLISHLLILWEQSKRGITLALPAFFCLGIMQALLGLGIFYNPFFNDLEHLSGTLIANTLMPAYLLPIVALFFLTKAILKHEDILHWAKQLGVHLDVARGTFVTLLFLFIVLQFRSLQLGSLGIHIKNEYLLITTSFAITLAFITAGALYLLELYPKIWQAVALKDQRDTAENKREIFPYALHIFLGAGMLLAVAGLCLSINPFFNMSQKITGGTFINTLAPAFLLPVLALGLMPKDFWQRTGKTWAMAAGATATLLAFTYLTLSVRWGYNGENIRWVMRPFGAERWTYSALWLSFGTFLLMIGIFRKHYELRLFSSPFIFLTVLKIFILDMAGLTGIWRPLSFIALGFVLIVIGYIYQKILFTDNKTLTIKK